MRPIVIEMETQSFGKSKKKTSQSSNSTTCGRIVSLHGRCVNGIVPSRCSHCTYVDMYYPPPSRATRLYENDSQIEYVQINRLTPG